MGLNDLLGGLGKLVEQFSQLAERAEALKKAQHEQQQEHGSAEAAGGAEPTTSFSGEADLGDKLKAVYGFTVRTGLGGDRGSVKVEPFGNVRKDERTGAAVVQEVREPAVDVFEEADHVLVVAEMPGVGEDAVRLELRDDVLTISAEQGPKKYRKEVLLPGGYTALSHCCRNGVLEVKVTRP